MKKIMLLATVIISGLFISCQEVITVDLEEGQNRLVVEGRIEKSKNADSGHQRINLSTTGDYFINNTTPRVSGASVSITDDHGQIVNFSENVDQAGLYETFNLLPEIGRTYTLSITYNGQTYRAVETLLPVAAIDSIYQVFVAENTFDEAGIRIKIDYTDPANGTNYYYWEQFQDGDSKITPNPGTKWTIIGNDELYNGQRFIGKIPNDELIYISGQKAIVRQIALSDYAYKYYFALFDQEGRRGGLSAPPAPIRGNIENISNLDDYALGYFYAAETDEAALVVK